MLLTLLCKGVGQKGIKVLVRKPKKSPRRWEAACGGDIVSTDADEKN